METSLNSNSSAASSIKPTWLFTDEELRQSPSMRAGMAYSEEQTLIRRGSTFIRKLASRLDDVQKEMPKISQLCVCVSLVQLRRFFTVQSLKHFDARDVGTAILFMSAKSEECPRRLEYFVRTWLKIRHEFDTKCGDPNDPLTVNKETFAKFCDYIIWLESIILQTIGFNLSIDVPHPTVLRLAQQLKPDDRPFQEALFWLSTDILHLTDWCLRYKSSTIGFACYYLASVWNEKQDSTLENGNSWINKVDKLVTLEQLQEMGKEFLVIWKDVDKEFHLATSRFDHCVYPLVLQYLLINRKHS